MFNDFNCRGCPIRGQREVSLTDEKDKQCLWKVVGGIIFESDDNQRNDQGNFDNSKDNKQGSDKEKDIKSEQFDGRRKNDL